MGSDDAAGWLATIDAGTALTIATSPTGTIVPPSNDASTAGTRALAALAQLAHRPAGSGEPLALGETLGEGGMGIVRSAEQVALGRTVAVKQLKAGQAAGAVLDLLREAWVTGSLEHPNIVPVHYLELDAEGRPVIVLKRIEGAAWKALLADPGTSVTDVLAWNIDILIQVLDALRFAHSRGIIHRDLKPANVMIGAFGEVYLLDWGIAVSLVDNGTGRLPLAKDATALAGTPAYMAPEMLGRDVPALSVRTDVYLAGSVLFEIITGAPPHRGATAHDVFASVIESQPTMPDDAPPELARICKRAMHADPEQRFPSVAELQTALRGYLEHRGSARLAETAHSRLDDLLRALSATGDQHDEIYRLFGACRFGFHEALIMWRDNDDARSGLRQAIVAVAEYELREDPRAAVTLLGELDDPPTELLARAREAAAAAAVRNAELELLARQHDASIGTRTRMFLALVLGTLFTVTPLFALHERLTPRSYIDHTLWSLAILTAVLGLGLWARTTIRKTLVNRRMYASVVFALVLQTSFTLAAPQLDLTALQLEQSIQFLWAAITGMATITIDRRMVGGALAFAGGFVASLVYPEFRLQLMSASCFVFMVTTAWQWRPATFRPTPEERARYYDKRP